VRKQTKTLLLAVVFLFHVGPNGRESLQAAEGTPEAPRPLRLREAVEMALRPLDPTGPEIAHWRVTEERGRLRPQLSFGGYSSFDTSTIVQSGGEGAVLGSGDRFYRSGADLVVSYSLLQFLESLPRIRQAEAERRAAVFRLRDEEGETIFRTSEAYLGLLSKQEALAALESLRREQMNFVRQQERKFQEELISSIDMIRLRSSLIALNREILATRGDIALAELNLRRLTRLEPEEPLELVFHPGEVDFAFIRSQGLAGLLALASDANPRLIAARASVDSARSGAEAARALRYPTLSASASSGVGRDQISGQNNFESTGFRYAVGLRFSIPIFDGGVRRAQITQANLRLDSQLRQSQLIAHDVKALIEEEYWSFIQKEEESALMDEEVRLAIDELRQVQSLFETGASRTTDVRDAVSNVMRLGEDSAKLKSEALLKGIKLALVVGRHPFTAFLGSGAATVQAAPTFPFASASGLVLDISESPASIRDPSTTPAAASEPAAAEKPGLTEPSPPATPVIEPAVQSTEADARQSVSRRPGRPARTLKNIQVTREDRSTKIRIVADGELENFRSFKLQEPDRLIIDLPGLTATTVKKPIPVHSPELHRVRIGTHPDKIRIVLDLAASDFGAAEIASTHEGVEIVLGRNR
jgi:outer membrane protein TolC